MNKVLTFVLAGGRGERLNPLTRDRTKPAVPVGGNYRIIDFTLSNCINSGMRWIYVLTQYKSFSLQKHLFSGWDVVSTQLGEFIDIIPAQQRISADWYRGTADAIYQNVYAIHDYDPELILILAGDHIYKMDYRAMIDFHKQMKADMTVACVPIPKETSPSFGVIEVDKKKRVLGFQEKPAEPRVIPGNPSHIFASMGIYLFNKNMLLQELEMDAQSSSEHDFGKNVIPQMLKNKQKVFVYDFVDDNDQPKYWRDVGTRDAYYEANMDLLGEYPALDLFDKAWPIRTYHEPFPPVKVIDTESVKSSIVDSMISGGCVIKGSTIEKSILSPSVTVYEGAEIKNSVIMEGVTIGKGAKIQNAIIDKQVQIPNGARIGYDLELDSKKFTLTTSKIVIVPKKMSVMD